MENLTNEEWSELTALSERLRTQDNMATGWPVFAVYEKKGKYGAFATAYFSRRGADDYLRHNGHNLDKAYVYVETGHRNLEWQLVRKLLLNLPALAPTTPALGEAESSAPDALTDLVSRFSAALLSKLQAARVKYGYEADGFLQTDWQQECLTGLHNHIAKGDPRDVAAYCAFMWHHGWSTATTPAAPAAGEAWVAIAEYRKAFTNLLLWWNEEGLPGGKPVGFIPQSDQRDALEELRSHVMRIEANLLGVSLAAAPVQKGGQEL